MSVWPESDPSSTPTSPTSPAKAGSSVLCVGRRLRPGVWIGTMHTPLNKHGRSSVIVATGPYPLGFHRTGLIEPPTISDNMENDAIS